MPARLFTACLAALLAAAAPALAASPAPPGKLVTVTYQVADLVVPVDDAPRTVALHPASPCQPTSCGTSAPKCTGAACGAHAPEGPKTMEDQLIKLIRTTVAPQSWDDMGGPGRIDYYPLSMALVINQTPDVQEQIADLLAALRHLQDQEVALEVRIIGVTEEVMTQLAADMPPALSPPGATAGAPQVRFLDDKHVSQFMEAIQGDRRTNVLQAPKITLFNGQACDVDLTEKQFFVTGLEVVAQPGGPLMFVPKNEPYETGLKMSAQPVISADQRSVRLDLRVKQTELDGIVPVVPVTAPIEPRRPDGTKEEQVPVTQFVQRPSFDSHALNVNLNIPAGGTALIQGWRHLREGRNEFGPPLLTKVPYISRLFKNVGNGREPEQVLIMVTARVLTSEETEEKVAAAPCPRAEPAPGAAEESEPAAAERKAPRPSSKTTKAREKKVARLLEKYHQACAEGHLEEAGKVARQALKLDPTCFAK
jgi:type II secretory pathway component GspD/PulD (secretin)